MVKVMRRIREKGFTLVELMIVVAIVGVLAVLAVYGVRKYIANSKTTEARNNLGQIKNDQAAAFEKETGGTAILALGGSTNILRALCPSGSAAIPQNINQVAAAKYQSNKTEWADGKGWACLKFSIEQPQYYQYDFQSGGGTTSYVAYARGDLNGDGATSEFALSGSVQAGVLTTSPTISELNPEE